MTPEILLQYLQDLRKDEPIIISESDLVFLRLAYDINASVLVEKEVPRIYDSLRFAGMLADILCAIDKPAGESTHIGCTILERGKWYYPRALLLRTVMLKKQIDKRQRQYSTWLRFVEYSKGLPGGTERIVNKAEKLRVQLEKMNLINYRKTRR